MFFNIGPLELVVLAFVGLVVLGPERLPGLARDAGRLLRGLREMATGARTQLREELGPEFADIDLRSLNPRTAITRALLGDDVDPGSLNTAAGLRSFLTDPGADAAPAADVKPVDSAMSRPVEPPLGRDEAVPFDTDAT
jgi:sec-independent protein translocase protein TatB